MSKTDKPERRPFHEEFAEKIIARLEEGTAPWQKPWTPGKQIMVPHNPASGTVYKGVNRVNLSMMGYDDPRWMTLKQANAQDLRVKSGSKSTMVLYFQWSEERDKLDDAGKPVLGEDGKPEKVQVQLERPLMRCAHVFNGEQIEGMPPLELSSLTYMWNPEEKAESLLAASGADIHHDQSNRAYYNPHSDSIHLPPRENFAEPGLYYGTTLHELGHWSGHSSRLNRQGGAFGSENYAREELRAEIASWMLGQDLGIHHNPDAHASYVGSWIKALKDDPYEIMRACRDAETIKDYLLDIERTKDLVVERRTPEKRRSEEFVAARSVPGQEKHWLAVPYVEKEEAKGLGARWDREVRSWYVPEGVDIALFEKWNKASTEKAPTLQTPEEEFAAQLREAGLVLDAPPLMDGELHRVPVERDKPNKDGAYTAYLDGRPAGYFENMYTGTKGNWKYSGHTLGKEELSRVREESAQRREQAVHDRKEQYEQAARRCYGIWKHREWAKPDQAYLARKQVAAFGVKQDDAGNLIIAGRDAAGRIQTLQTITEEGKFFARGSQKAGACHIIDPQKKFGTEPILVAEGYATGASLHMALGKPVVCAFDAGNLLPVVERLRDQFPDQTIAIMADNDQAGKVNKGIECALAVAEKVSNVLVYTPAFTLEQGQRGLSDFNDLHVTQGVEAIVRQVDFSKPLNKTRENEKTAAKLEKERGNTSKSESELER